MVACETQYLTFFKTEYCGDVNTDRNTFCGYHYQQLPCVEGPMLGTLTHFFSHSKQAEAEYHYLHFVNEKIDVQKVKYLSMVA